MGKGFGIDIPLAHEVGTQMVQAFNSDQANQAYELWDNSYYDLPTPMFDPQSRFRSNFFNAYEALITQRKSIGNALNNAATDAEMTDLQISHGFHPGKNGLLPQEDAPPS
jgi:hypothetical protein